VERSRNVTSRIVGAVQNVREEGEEKRKERNGEIGEEDER